MSDDNLIICAMLLFLFLILIILVLLAFLQVVKQDYKVHILKLQRRKRI